MSPETREAIDGLLRDNRVVVFMKGNRAQPQCGFSAKTVAALDMMLPDYISIDVLQNTDIRDGIKAYGNWPTIPQLYVNGELIGGSDIVTEMFESGELGSVLGMAEPAGKLPDIAIDPAAADIMANAIQSQPDNAIHLKINASFEHSMSLAPPRPGSLTVVSGPVSLQLDRWSASRADGLRVRVRESLQGQGFNFDNPNAPPPVKTMTVQELKAAFDRHETPWLFDVRGDDERATASLPAARPWNEDSVRAVDALPPDTPIIFFCHRGGRSLAAAERYRRRGYTNLYNLTGGIDAWSREIDDSVPIY
ncbi:MAG: Grx4 family monothiol glutaredoxin [Chromatiales bacterium]|jgi:monothiol glutaredoxin|nr:MAG: Grx4 family monothiol glutaredoxin [Chromatiales bacterium]